MNLLPHTELYDEEIKGQKKYFSKWSEYFRIAKTVSLLAFISTILISVFFFGDSITYDNFQLLIRNIDSEYYSSSEKSQNVIYYNSDNNTVFEELDGNLIIAENQTVSLYSMSGRKIYSYSDSFSSPIVVTSDKYFIVYEQNGNKFSVYGKIGLLYQENACEFPITCAYISDSGKFLIGTKSREYSTCVLLYNEKFSLMGEYKNSRYLISCSLSQDGKYVALATAEAENGVYKTVTTLYNTSNLYKSSNIEPDFKAEISGAFPLKIYFTKQNKVLLCCDDMTLVYNSDGSINSSYSYDRDSLTHLSYNGNDRIALIFSSEERIDKSSVNVIDISGKLIYNNKNVNRVNDISYKNDTLYLLSDGMISKLSEEGEIEEKALDFSHLIRRVFTYNNRSAIAVSNDASYLVNFD